MKELSIIVQGRVQGVNFRNTVKKYADSVGLKGYVQNKSDGKVMVIAQGDKDRLRDFINWLNGSPGFSKVDSISVDWRDSSGVFSDFRVEREKGFFHDRGRSLVNLFKFMARKNRIENIEGEKNIPQHVAIIPDGNRRWARERGLESSSGHYSAAQFDHGVSLVEEAKKNGVKCFSIWAFSTENWKRERKEVDAIFDLTLSWLNGLVNKLHEEKMRFVHVGRKDRIPEKLAARIAKIERETKLYTGFTLVLCLDYGGRDEIVRAVNKMFENREKKIDEAKILQYLDTKEIPEPDLIIRTGGEKRLSGFMLYQSAYAELYFTETYFPDFGPQQLREALDDFAQRKRRFGC